MGDKLYMLGSRVVDLATQPAYDSDGNVLPPNARAVTCVELLIAFGTTGTFTELEAQRVLGDSTNRFNAFVKSGLIMPLGEKYK